VLALAGASPRDEGGTLGAGSAADATGVGVTVLVTEDEARAVAYAAAIGEVMLALAPAQTACCGGPAS
jgi:hypothetical protein